MAAKGDVGDLFSSLAGVLNFAKPDALGSEGLPKAGCEPGDEVAQTGALFPRPLDDPKVALPLAPPRAEPKTWPFGGVAMLDWVAGWPHGETLFPRALAAPIPGTPGAPNAGCEGFPNAGVDGLPKAGADGFPKAGVAACPNVGVDACPNAGADGFPKAGVEACPNAGVDDCPNAGVDACPNAGLGACPNEDLPKAAKPVAAGVAGVAGVAGCACVGATDVRPG
jgi:hypothetical protein